jgi:hypothetical protein
VGTNGNALHKPTHAGPNRPITKRDIVSGPKWILEGTPAESDRTGLVDGYPNLTLRLPEDKYAAWSSNLRLTRVITYGEPIRWWKVEPFLIPARHF